MKQTQDSKKFEVLANIAEICARQGVEDIIISPGSRSAPLTVSFARHPALRCRVVLDERAAGFIALGLAQQTRRPVGLVCTSGTAALNYGPAVTEAFYQQIPLLVFTADRPAEWIDQQDGQAIHQQRLYEPHCRGSFAFPVDYTHPDAHWHVERLISEAINRATWPTPGPVHLNVPLREPLYPPPGEHYHPSTTLKIIQQPSSTPTLTEETWINLLSAWRHTQRKLVIVGSYTPSASLKTALAELQRDPNVTVIADITANLHQEGLHLPHSDMILGSKAAETLEKLKPDLLISFGGPLVSKYLKLFLRNYRPQAQWHIQADGQPVDTFQMLTQVIPVQAEYFFETLRTRQAYFLSKNSTSPLEKTYQYFWRELEAQAQQFLPVFLGDTPFNEFSAVSDVMQALPAGSYLQLGNSMPIRYANFIGLGADVAAAGIKVNANRGTSGIDGSLSTTVGAALATAKITTLISGDVAFFYDRNALWHQHVPPNLRVVILNNRGGGIFKLIDGPSNLPPAELEQYFFTPQPLTAKNTAADHNCRYFYCDNAQDLAHHLPEFFAPSEKPAILEIETDNEVNTQVFQQFKAAVAQLALTVTKD